MRNWIGKSYEEVGPCWAFAKEYLAERDRFLPMGPCVRGGLRQAKAYAAWQSKFTQHERPHKGHLVLFRIPRSEVSEKVYPFRFHCGVMLDEFRFIHAEEKMGVVISRLSNPMFGPFVVGYFTYGS